MKKRHRGPDNRKLFALILILLLLLAVMAYQSQAQSQPVSLPVPDGSQFSVHFIDEGQADSALVQCDGEYMLIDGGNVADSSLVVSYLRSAGVDELEYVVCTHAHEDHVGGLSGPLNAFPVETVYAPVTEYESRAFTNFSNYAQPYGGIQIPQAGDSFMLGAAKVEVLGPLKEYEETNDTSIVLKVTYGSTSFLFTGDMEEAAEHDLMDARTDLSATVLKAGHHGSITSSSYVFLREVMPKYVVISVGEDNSYGHPSEEVLSRYRDVKAEVYRTDMQGNILAVSDGETVTFTSQSKPQWPTNPTEGQQPSQQIDKPAYIGNSGTMKFHKPDCASAKDMAKENRVEFFSRQEASAQGYEPCGRCKP